MARLLVLSIVALALTAAGCGSSNGSSSSGSGYGGGTATKAATTAAAAPAAGSGAAAVKIANFAFAPKNVTVKVGQKIEWTNTDSTAHDVVADSGASFKSDAIDQGGTYSYTPTKAGKITYECTFHPQMKGYTITVTG
jgi:plastocyanin